MSDETTLWQGSPSQVLNLPVFLVCGVASGVMVGAALLFGATAGQPVTYALTGAAILSVLYASYRALLLKTHRYEVTTERLRLRQGILTRRTDEIELYRVRDYVIIEPLSLRFFGVSDLSLTTDDTANPTVVLRAIPDAQRLKDQIRQHVEICRDRKRVRIMEMEGPQS